MQVSDELFAGLHERFDDGELVELVNVIAVENLRSRFNAAFAIGSTGFSEGMACAHGPGPVTAPSRSAGEHELARVGEPCESPREVFLAGATGVIGRRLVPMLSPPDTRSRHDPLPRGPTPYARRAPRPVADALDPRR